MDTLASKPVLDQWDTSPFAFFGIDFTVNTNSKLTLFLQLSSVLEYDSSVHHMGKKNKKKTAFLVLDRVE